MKNRMYVAALALIALLPLKACDLAAQFCEQNSNEKICSGTPGSFVVEPVQPDQAGLRINMTFTNFQFTYEASHIEYQISLQAGKLDSNGICRDRQVIHTEFYSGREIEFVDRYDQFQVFYALDSDAAKIGPEACLVLVVCDQNPAKPGFCPANAKLRVVADLSEQLFSGSEQELNATFDWNQRTQPK